MLQVYSHAGTEAADQGAHRPDISSVGTLATDWGAYPPGVSGVGTQPGALGLCAQVAGPLIWVRTNPRLWTCVLGQPGC